MESWIIYALLTMVGFAVTVLTFKKLSASGFSSGTINFYFFLLVALGIVIYNFATGSSFKADYKFFLILLIAVVAGVFANIYNVKAIHASPNPGYASAIVAVNAILVAIIAVFLFHSKLTLIKMLGVVLAVIGVILISL